MRYISHLQHGQPKCLVGYQVKSLSKVHEAQKAQWGCWCSLAFCITTFMFAMWSLSRVFLRNPACSSATSDSVLFLVISIIYFSMTSPACETEAIRLALPWYSHERGISPVLQAPTKSCIMRCVLG